MAKQKAAEGAPQEAKGVVTIRKGLYRGPDGRAFVSVPLGETMVCRSGRIYEVRETFAYLWVDPQFAMLFEWKGEPEEVPAINEGQIPPPA
jgi:hypothetical protein